MLTGIHEDNSMVRCITRLCAKAGLKCRAKQKVDFPGLHLGAAVAVCGCMPVFFVSLFCYEQYPCILKARGHEKPAKQCRQLELTRASCELIPSATGFKVKNAARSQGAPPESNRHVKSFWNAVLKSLIEPELIWIKMSALFSRFEKAIWFWTCTCLNSSTTIAVDAWNLFNDQLQYVNSNVTIYIYCTVRIWCNTYGRACFLHIYIYIYITCRTALLSQLRGGPEEGWIEFAYTVQFTYSTVYM